MKLIFQLTIHTLMHLYNFWFIYFWLHACFNTNLVLENVYLAQVIISSLVQDERYWLVRFVASCFFILKSTHGSAHQSPCTDFKSHWIQIQRFKADQVILSLSLSSVQGLFCQVIVCTFSSCHSELGLGYPSPATWQHT